MEHSVLWVLDPSGNRQSSKNIPVKGRRGCRTVLTVPSHPHMAVFKLLWGTLKEARHLVSGADQPGCHQEFRSGVPLPEPQPGCDTYVRKVCLRWMSAPMQCLGILPRAVAGQWMHLSLFLMMPEDQILPVLNLSCHPFEISEGKLFLYFLLPVTHSQNIP